MKDPRFSALRTRTERALEISGDACRVMMRICSMIYSDPHRRAEDAFPLTWFQVACWTGVKEEKAAYRKIDELVRHGFLKCDGLRGCPPQKHFFLVFNSPEKGGIDSPKNGGNVTPEKGGNDSPEIGGDHKSNSFQEERLKERGAKNSSLRSAGTQGKELSAAPKLLPREEVATELKRLSRALRA